MLFVFTNFLIFFVKLYLSIKLSFFSNLSKNQKEKIDEIIKRSDNSISNQAIDLEFYELDIN
jgi:hypothetical protein